MVCISHKVIVWLQKTKKNAVTSCVDHNNGVFWQTHFWGIATISNISNCFLQLGAESGVDNPNLKAMKTVFRIMPFVILPMTINFPTVSLSHSFLPQVFFNCICYGIWSVFSCHAVTISIVSLICVFYRRCSPTGWPLTSSHWVRWPCWDTRSWDRSYASRNASHTQLQRFLPMKVS